eukprot:8132752-Pyramimonas_sp.AAC.1
MPVYIRSAPMSVWSLLRTTTRSGASAETASLISGPRRVPSSGPCRPNKCCSLRALRRSP